MSATRKPWLTRRRVITLAALLVVILAVAGFMLGVFDPAEPVKVTFVRFERSDDGTATMAVLRLTNEANHTFQFQHHGSGTTFGRFVSRDAKKEVTWTPDYLRSAFLPAFLPREISPFTDSGFHRSSSLPLLITKTNWITMGGGFTTPFQPVLFPHSEVTQGVRLPTDGRRGCVAILCLPPTRSLPGFMRFARSLLWKWNALGLKPFWTECNQEIKCPLVRPDGTVEPPWLVGRTEKKR